MPRFPLVLGLLGTLPFLAAALSSLISITLPAKLTGPGAGITYGVVILCFMSGILWGFATNAKAKVAGRAYVLSVVPALWVFFSIGASPLLDLTALIAGFIGVLSIEFWFQKHQLTPDWWLRMRGILTTIVVICLAVCARAVL